MNTNVGSVDRGLRLVLGLVLLAAPFVSGAGIFNSGVVTAISIVAGLVMVATAAMKFCPLYTVFGIRTCKV